MALKTLIVPVVLFASVLATPAITWAEKGGPDAIIDQADTALAHALPVVFENGKMATRSLPAIASSRHLITLGELEFHPTDRLDVHAGGGLAQLVDAPAGCGHTGYAVGGGASLALLRPAGFQVGVQVSAVHVAYGGSGFTDGTMLVALATR
jgi:hypothetical protein